MAKPIGVAILFVVLVACSAKPKDGAPGGPKGIGDVDGPQAPPDAAPEAAPAPAATAAATSRDIEVRGTIETADDLEVIAPVATTLTLADGAVAETAVPYAVECVTLDAQRKTCSAPVEPTAPRAGTFSLSCPGMGAASIACNLRRGTTLDAIILGDASLLNVGEGIVDLKLASAADQLPKGSLEPTSTALATVDELATRFAAKPTDLSESFTGNWLITPIEVPAEESLESSTVYFRDRSIDGTQRKIEIWDSQAAYDRCHAGEDDRLAQHFLFDGKRFDVDETSAETLTASVESIAAAFFDPDVERSFKVSNLFNGEACTGDWCAPRTEGPFKGRPKDEVLRQLDFMQFAMIEAMATSLETALESCPRPPDDLSVCRDIGTTNLFCLELIYQVGWLFGRTVDLETLAPFATPPDFTECLGDVPNGLNPICQVLQPTMAEIGVKWQAGQRWVLDASVVPQEFLSDALRLCPVEASSETAQPVACRAEFLAASPFEQDAAVTGLIELNEGLFYGSQICPGVKPVFSAPTPDAGIAANVACRQSYMAASIDERRRRLTLSAQRMLSFWPNLACIAPKRAEAIVAAIDVSCLRLPFRLSILDPDCVAQYGCFPSKLLPLRDVGAPLEDMMGYASTMGLVQGVDGAFAMNSIRRIKYSDLAPPDYEPVECESRYESVFNATATSKTAFDADHQIREQEQCSHEMQARPGYSDGLFVRYRFTRQ